jgi:FdhE protein
VISLLQAALNGDNEPLERTAQVLGLDEAILPIIAHNCLKPFLHAWQKTMAPLVDVSAWQKGHCPFCGSPPILAELRGPQRARYLRCGLCGADWPFVRLQCAFCGNLEHQSLGILQLEQDPELVSIQQCAVCHAYLKMVVTLEPIAADLLPLADLSTVSLDIIAAKHGFSRPG